MTFSVWRLEPGGAEGQLESMATGTPMMLPLWLEKAQVLSRRLLHNGNCTMANQAGWTRTWLVVIALKKH